MGDQHFNRNFGFTDCWRENIHVLVSLEVVDNGQFRKYRRWLENIDNKAISMMRGKSLSSDVEMSEKLIFVEAVLDFWRSFLNQF